MNRAVAGCRTMMSITSSPLKRPRCPRKCFSPSSWSFSLYTKGQLKRLNGPRGSLGPMVQPVKALAHS